MPYANKNLCDYVCSTKINDFNVGLLPTPFSVQTVWTEKIFDNEEGTTQCHCGKKTTNKTFSIISSKQPVCATITVGCGQLAGNMQTDN